MRFISMFIMLSLLSFHIFAGDKIPVSAFARLPAIKSVDVSPDGNYIAAQLANDKGYYDIAVTEFDKIDFKVVTALQSPRDRILWIAWASNTRLLVAAAFPYDAGGYAHFTGKLYTVDVKSGKVIELKPKGLQVEWKRRYSNNTRVVSFLPDDPDHILVQWWGRYDDHPAVYKVDVNSGDYEVYLNNDYEIDSWYADRYGNILFGYQYDVINKETNDIDLSKYKLWMPDDDGKWRIVAERDRLNDAYFSPQVMTDDGKFLYVLSNHLTDEIALYTYDVEHGKFIDQVFHVPGYDLDGTLIKYGRLVGVTWTEHFTKDHYFDEESKKLADLVNNTFKGAEVSITSSSLDNKRMVVYAVRDDLPGMYYLLDLKAGKASFWFSRYPELTGVKLSKINPFEFVARDGMKLNGYYSLPVDGRTDAALVVVPHGGPASRDTQYFDFWTQFLTNRGYAVLAVNFRGSDGFGNAYLRAGYKQWGLKMQDDVIDAVKWVKEHELANTEKACITGGSYGGYVALVAAAKNQDVFDCAMSIAGVTDIVELIKKETALYAGSEYRKDHIGDIDDPEEKKMLEANSPINLIEKMNIPVLLFHGTNDDRVSYMQSEDFYNRAKFIGKDNIEYIEIPEATHYLDDGSTRQKAFEEMERFLEENLN